MECEPDLTLPGGDEAFRVRAHAGGYGAREVRQRTQVRRGAVGCDPTLQVKGQRPFGGNPLAVVFARQMDVRSGALSPLARGMAERVASLQLRPNCHTSFRTHV